MELAGAVFLPFTGTIWISYITSISDDYQTRTYDAESNTYQLIDFLILKSLAGTEEDGLKIGFPINFGKPVRLIQYYTPSVKVE